MWGSSPARHTGRELLRRRAPTNEVVSAGSGAEKERLLRAIPAPAPPYMSCMPAATWDARRSLERAATEAPVQGKAQTCA